LISRVVVGLPRSSGFSFWAEGPLSVRLSSHPTFLSLVIQFLPDKAFFLYNTLGFPINLMELMAQEAGMTVDMEGFIFSNIQTFGGYALHSGVVSGGGVCS
jgi:hypothetical protein